MCHYLSLYFTGKRYRGADRHCTAEHAGPTERVQSATGGDSEGTQRVLREETALLSQVNNYFFLMLNEPDPGLLYFFRKGVALPSPFRNNQPCARRVSENEDFNLGKSCGSQDRQ